ncbi:decapping 5-like protein isoform X3 [Mangifera indica]|uniref:decapping 5-like protein isoform X3 n=1 Tax=Mangifera indica TaxID=29780 RepID=UPI001CFA0094|nr:decapping 5-like protein isoform X3 [Mangifera indica]
MTTGNSKAGVESYIGSFISLISKYEIRYEGVLYYLSVSDSTIGLKTVRSFGTEGRKKDGPQVAASDKVYEYILFRGSDIKDLEVKSSPSPQREDQIYEDPAIIQYAGVPMNSPPSASFSGKTLMESIPWQDTSALTTRDNPGEMLTYQPVTQVGSLNQSEASKNSGAQSFSTPMYWQGYNGRSSNSSHSPLHPISFYSPSTVSSPLTMQNDAENSEPEASLVFGLITALEPASTSLNPSFLSPLTPTQCSMSPVMPFSSSSKASPSSTAPYMTDNDLNMSLVPSSSHCTKTVEAQNACKPNTEILVDHPAQSMSYPASSFPGYASGTLLTPPPSLLTSVQLVSPRPPVLSTTQKTYADQKDMGAFQSTSYNPPFASAEVTQAPLLPLPTPAPPSRYSTTLFTEEFDFEAMNEKFKKNEVWGSLGKAKQSDKSEDVENQESDQGLADKEAYAPIDNSEPKPAYNKDDFFDTISCNSLNRGTRNGQNRFSERMKLDAETFGNFRQRPHLGYGSYGGGRGDNYRGSYAGGRGYGPYGYGYRGRGGYMHI